MRTRKHYDDFADHLKHRMRTPRFREALGRAEEEGALARQLIQLRTEQGLTQAQVAAMVNTTQSCLSRLERHPPRKVTPLLRRLAQLYGREVRVEVRLVPLR
ncbi:MAG: helix-turn-helix transcriptional regulator [Armatimonadota bacterium]